MKKTEAAEFSTQIQEIEKDFFGLIFVKENFFFIKLQ